jgi:capsular polysaccharide biosynthesis protein
MDDGFAPLDLLARILRQWPVILAATLVAALVALGFSTSQPLRYTATAEMVVGGYSLPADLNVQAALDKTGPLGLDLPGETQARVIVSPLIIDKASSTLGLDTASSASLQRSARAKAVTDNAIVLAADGPTLEAAVARVNAIAAAYMDYRSGLTRQALSAVEQQARADSAASARELQSLSRRIATAAAGDNQGLLTALMAQQRDVADQARQSSTTATEVATFAKSFAGGATLTQPATASSVTSSPLVARDVLFGSLFGALLGLVLALLRDKVSDRLQGRQEAEAISGVPVMLDVAGKRRRIPSTDLAVRAVETSRQLHGHPDVVVVRPLTNTEGAAWAALALSRAYSSIGRASVVGADRVSEQLLAASARVAPHLARADGAGVELRLTASHSRPDISTAWPEPGALCLLVVDLAKDTRSALQQAVTELAVGGFPVAGLITIRGAAGVRKLAGGAPSTVPGLPTGPPAAAAPSGDATPTDEDGAGLPERVSTAR